MIIRFNKKTWKSELYEMLKELHHEIPEVLEPQFTALPRNECCRELSPIEVILALLTERARAEDKAAASNLLESLAKSLAELPRVSRANAVVQS